MSTGEGPDAELERLRAALYGPDAPPGAAEAYRAAIARTSAPADRDGRTGVPGAAGGTHGPAAGTTPVARATDVAAEPLRPAARRHGLRTAVVAAAALVAAGGAAVLLAPHPDPEPVAAPLRLGPAIWSTSGTAGAASPTLDGGGAPVFVHLRCRGEGRVLLALDGRVRSVGCAAGRTTRDDQYFDGPHDEFLLSLSLVGRPSWTASVHRVLPPPDR